MDFQPIFHKKADNSTGEVLPTVWYASIMEATSIQQAIMSKAVLLAEKPIAKSVPSPSPARKTLP